MEDHLVSITDELDRLLAVNSNLFNDQVTALKPLETSNNSEKKQLQQQRKSRIYLKNVEYLREPQREPIEQQENQITAEPFFESHMISPSLQLSDLKEVCDILDVPANSLTPSVSTPNSNSNSKPKQKISIKSVDVLREPALLHRDYEQLPNFVCTELDMLPSSLSLPPPPPPQPQTSVISQDDFAIMDLIHPTTTPAEPRRPKIYIKNVDILKEPLPLSNVLNLNGSRIGKDSSIGFTFIPSTCQSLSTVAGSASGSGSCDNHFLNNCADSVLNNVNSTATVYDVLPTLSTSGIDANIVSLTNGFSFDTTANTNSECNLVNCGVVGGGCSNGDTIIINEAENLSTFNGSIGDANSSTVTTNGSTYSLLSNDNYCNGGSNLKTHIMTEPTPLSNLISPEGLFESIVTTNSTPTATTTSLFTHTTTSSTDVLFNNVLPSKVQSSADDLIIHHHQPIMCSQFIPSPTITSISVNSSAPSKQKIFIKNVDVLKAPQFQEHRRTLHLRTVDELNLMNKNDVENLFTPNLELNNQQFNGDYQQQQQLSETIQTVLPVVSFEEDDAVKTIAESNGLNGCHSVYGELDHAFVLHENNNSSNNNNNSCNGMPDFDTNVNDWSVGDYELDEELNDELDCIITEMHKGRAEGEISDTVAQSIVVENMLEQHSDGKKASIFELESFIASSSNHIISLLANNDTMNATTMDLVNSGGGISVIPSDIHNVDMDCFISGSGMKVGFNVADQTNANESSISDTEVIDQQSLQPATLESVESHTDVEKEIDSVEEQYQEEDSSNTQSMASPAMTDSNSSNSLLAMAASPHPNELKTDEGVKNVPEMPSPLNIVNSLTIPPPLVQMTQHTNKVSEATAENEEMLASLPVPPLVPLAVLPMKKPEEEVPPVSVIPLRKPTKKRIYVARNLMKKTKSKIPTSELIPDASPDVSPSLQKKSLTVESSETPTHLAAVAVTGGTSVKGRPFGANCNGMRKMRKKIGDAADLETGIKCTVQCCIFRFKKAETLEYHKRCHSNSPQRIICPECGESSEFANWNTLHTHLWRSHHIDMELYSCELCTFKTPIYSRLINTHSKIHFDERNYKCEQCDKAFKNTKQLKNHRRCHRMHQTQQQHSQQNNITVTSIQEDIQSVPKVHRCGTCNAAFSNYKSLREHICPEDVNIPALECDICGRSFSSKSSLKLHCRTHELTKRFKCTHCTYTGSDHNAFRRHKMTHENGGGKAYRYNCPACPYVSIQSVAYQKHIRLKHPKVAASIIYNCTECGFGTINRALFVVHQTKHEGSSSHQPSNEPRTKEMVSAILAYLEQE